LASTKSTKLTAAPRRNGIKARACALFPGALGDFICAQPALLRLAQDFQLTVLARTEYGDLLPSEITIDSIERPEIARLFVAGGSRDRAVRQFFTRFACVYSWTGAGQPVFVHELQGVADARIFPFRPAVWRRHQADYYYLCVDSALSTSTPLPKIPLRQAAMDWWEDYMQREALLFKPLLVIAPGSGGLDKNWPVPAFSRVAEWWQANTNGSVVTLLGPAEEERGGAPDLASKSLMLRGVSLAQAAVALARCDVYVGNDSGISHLAGAVGAPTLALFGPSDPLQWAPRGARVTVLRAGVACARSSSEQTKTSQRHRLTVLESAKVIQKLEELLRAQS